MKYYVFVIICLLEINCANKQSQVESLELRQDSIYSDFSTLVLMAYLWNGSYVMDEIFENFDTIQVTRDHMIPKYVLDSLIEDAELLEIKKGYYLLPIEEIPRLRRLNVYKVEVYDDKFKYLGDGICSTELLIGFREPDIHQQKSDFYDRQKLLVKKARRMLSKTYNISEDSLERVIYFKLESHRNDSLLQNFHYAQ